MTLSPRTLLGLALSALAVGCAAPSIDPAEEQLAADGTQAMEASSQSTSMGQVVFDNVSASDPTAAAAMLSQPSKWPSACVTRAQDPISPAVSHLTLDDCTGPFGLVHIDGDEVVTFSAGDGALHATFAGANVTADGRPVAYSAGADLTFPDLMSRTVIWKGSWSRVDDAGETVAHTLDVEITVDLATHCASSTGSAVTMVDDREVDSSITGYELCRDPATGAVGCPKGTVTHTGELSGKTVTVRFDGSDLAQVTGPGGASFGVAMACTALGQ
jgi:hypothetical protein